MRDKNQNIIIGLVVVLIIAIGIFIVALLKIQDKPNNENTAEGFKLEGSTIDELADCIVDYYITSDMTDYEKYKVLHDYIVDTTYYDWETVGNSNTSGHDGRSVLLLGKGVCDAYAYAYQALCESAGLYCDVISGKTPGSDFLIGHAWNIVRVGKNYYHVDVTWDDPDKEEDGFDRCYYYFMLSDKALEEEGRVFSTKMCKDRSLEYLEVGQPITTWYD